VIFSVAEGDRGVRLVTWGAFHGPSVQRLLRRYEQLLADALDWPTALGCELATAGSAPDNDALGTDRADLLGFRLRIGDLEQALGLAPGVAEAAAAVVVGAGEPRLVAYVVAPRDPPSLAEARRAVWDRLPGYAWPAAVVTVPALPRRPDGSADRLALPLRRRPAAVASASPPGGGRPSPVPGGRPVARRMTTTTGSNSPSSTVRRAGLAVGAGRWGDAARWRCWRRRLRAIGSSEYREREVATAVPQGQLTEIRTDQGRTGGAHKAGASSCDAPASSTSPRPSSGCTGTPSRSSPISTVTLGAGRLPSPPRRGRARHSGPQGGRGDRARALRAPLRRRLPGRAVRCWPTTSPAGPRHSAIPVLPGSWSWLAASHASHRRGASSTAPERRHCGALGTGPGRSCSPGASPDCATCSRCRPDRAPGGPALPPARLIQALTARLPSYGTRARPDRPRVEGHA
jgi:hypothetical protein